MGIASILKFFKFLYIIFWSVSSLLSSNNFEFQMDYIIPDNGVLTLKEGTYLNFTFNTIYNLTRPGLLIQINSLKNGKITVTNCLLLMDCSETIYNKTCRCLFPGGPFQFTKTVHRTDDKAIYMWLAEDEKFNKFAQRNVTFNVTYPPRVTELLVDNKNGVRVHLMLPNESFTVICRWENGNPPTLPRLLDSEGTHLKITKENGTHVKGQHSFLRCHVIERIRCEVDGSDRNMSATVMAKCPPEFGIASGEFHSATKGENAVFRFQLYAHSAAINKCQITKLPEQLITKSNVYVDHRDEDIRRKPYECEVHCRRKHKCWCELIGTEPNFTLYLQFQNVAKNDGGLWSVNLSNDIGSDSTSFNITINEVID